MISGEIVTRNRTENVEWEIRCDDWCWRDLMSWATQTFTLWNGRRPRSIHNATETHYLEPHCLRIRRWSWHVRAAFLRSVDLNTVWYLIYSSGICQDPFVFWIPLLMPNTKYRRWCSLNHSELVAWNTSVAFPMVTFWMLKITAYST